MRASWNVGSRVAAALQFAGAGLLETSSSLLSAVLSRDAFNGQALKSARVHSQRDQKARSVGLLALLGQRYQKGILSLKEVVRLLIDPLFGTSRSVGNAIAIPLQFATQLAYQALVEPTKLAKKPLIPTNVETRDHIWGFMEATVAQSILDRAIRKNNLLTELFANWRGQIISKYIFQPYYADHLDPDYGKAVPVEDLPARAANGLRDLSLLLEEVWATAHMYNGDFDILLRIAKEKNVGIDEAFALLDMVDSKYMEYYVPEKTTAPKTLVVETSEVGQILSPIMHPWEQGSQGSSWENQMADLSALPASLLDHVKMLTELSQSGGLPVTEDTAESVYDSSGPEEFYNPYASDEDKE